MKNYYFTLEIANINPLLSETFKDKFSLIENCNQILLQSKYFLTKESCIESLLVDFNNKSTYIENIHTNIFFPKISSDNPSLDSDYQSENEDQNEEYKPFWTKDKLCVYCLIDQENDTFFLRYTVYQEDDSIIYKESLQDYNYLYPDFNNNNYIQ